MTLALIKHHVSKDAGHEQLPRLSHDVRLSIARSLAKKLDAEDELLYFLGLSDNELLERSRDAAYSRQKKQRQFDSIWL